MREWKKKRMHVLAVLFRPWDGREREANSGVNMANEMLSKLEPNSL